MVFRVLSGGTVFCGFRWVAVFIVVIRSRVVKFRGGVEFIALYGL